MASPVWIELGKLVLGAIMVAFALVGILVAVRFDRWHAALVQLETVACRARDDAMFEMTAARQRLRSFKSRFDEKEDRQDLQEVSRLLQNAGSVISMIMAREKSFLQWGFAGVKLANTAMKYWKNRGKS